MSVITFQEWVVNTTRSSKSRTYPRDHSWQQWCWNRSSMAVAIPTSLNWCVLIKIKKKKHIILFPFIPYIFEVGSSTTASEKADISQAQNETTFTQDTQHRLGGLMTSNYHRITESYLNKRTCLTWNCSSFTRASYTLRYRKKEEETICASNHH